MSVQLHQNSSNDCSVTRQELYFQTETIIIFSYEDNSYMLTCIHITHTYISAIYLINILLYLHLYIYTYVNVVCSYIDDKKWNGSSNILTLNFLICALNFMDVFFIVIICSYDMTSKLNFNQSTEINVCGTCNIALAKNTSGTIKLNINTSVRQRSQTNSHNILRNINRLQWTDVCIFEITFY